MTMLVTTSQVSVGSQHLRPPRFTGTSLSEFDKHVCEVRQYAQSRGCSYMFDIALGVPPVDLTDQDKEAAMHDRGVDEPGDPTLAADLDLWRAQASRYQSFEVFWNGRIVQVRHQQDLWRQNRDNNELACLILAECFLPTDYNRVRDESDAQAQLQALRRLFDGNVREGLAAEQWGREWYTLHTMPHHTPATEVFFTSYPATSQ
ncbi:hypothetical protein HDU96_002083 [Phlyctochytrium bullatum]|nr:hypothetical protein HDU96_002083 [Phlyctochytrium bullatum]